MLYKLSRYFTCSLMYPYFIFHVTNFSYMYCMLTCRLNKISLKTCYHCWKGSVCVYSFLIKGHVEKQETEISFTLLHKKIMFLENR